MLTDESPMPWGKYKGKAMANVPADYLIYLYQKGLQDGPVKVYIEDNWDALELEAGKDKLSFD